MKYTIEQFKLGKVWIKYTEGIDDLKLLNKVLQLALPGSMKAVGNCKFYKTEPSRKWIGENYEGPADVCTLNDIILPPKFKVGDWIVNVNNPRQTVYRITQILDGARYKVEDNKGVFKGFYTNDTLLRLATQEEIEAAKPFTLPEKWCIKNTDSIIGNWFDMLVTGGNSALYETCGSQYILHYPEYFGGHLQTFPYYTEITLEQFKKYVLTQNIKEVENKEITGYKAPINMFGDLLKAGDIITQNKVKGGFRYYYLPGMAGNTNIPAEIVHTWEPVYKETSKHVTIFQQEGRLETHFMLTLLPEGKVFYKPDNYTFVSGDIYNLKQKLGAIEIADGGVGKYDFKITKIDWGCKEGILVSSLHNFIEEYNAFNAK